MEQGVITVKGSEPTADEYLSSLKTKSGQSDLMYESLGLQPEPKQITETPKEEKPVEVPAPVEPPKEEPKKEVKETAAQKLAKALGTIKPNEPEAVLEKDKKDLFEKLQAENAALKRTLTIQEEEGAYKNLLSTMSEEEAEIVMDEIVNLVKTEDYQVLKGMTVEKRTAWAFGNAKTLAAERLEEVKRKQKEKHEEAEKTLKTVISNPATNTNGGGDGAELKELERRASNGDSDAEAELIFRRAPGANATFNRILKNMKDE